MWQELMRPRRVWLAVVAIVAIALGVGVALNDQRASSVKQAKRYFFEEFSSRRSEMLSSWRSQINVDMGKFPPAGAAEALTELLNENAKRSLPPSRYGKAYYRLPRTIRSYLPYPRIRAAAVDALSRIGPAARDDLPRLNVLCDDDSQMVREAATNAVRVLTKNAR